MAFKSTLSMVALVAAIMSAGSVSARHVNSKIAHTITLVYEQFQKDGRTGELSDDVAYLYNCLQKQDNNCDEARLHRIIQELQQLGYLQKSAPSSVGLLTHNVR